MPKLTLRIDLGAAGAIGPGKVRLLELVAEHGSIRRAASAMKMSYRRAWLLLQSLGETFGAPVVVATTGGARGGGARLSALGEGIVRDYRRAETKATAATAAELAALARAAQGKPAKSVKPRRLSRAHP